MDPMNAPKQMAGIIAADPGSAGAARELIDEWYASPDSHTHEYWERLHQEVAA